MKARGRVTARMKAVVIRRDGSREQVRFNRSVLCRPGILGRLARWLASALRHRMPLGLWATVFTTVGKQWSVDAWDGTVSTTPQYMAWGTGAGTAAVGDTTLFTEASEARVAGTLSQPSADTFQNLATMTADGSKTITNAGVFTASSGGTLIVKGDFTGVALGLNEEIAFTVTLQQT